MTEKLLIIDATTRCNQKCLFCFERNIHFTKPDLALNTVKIMVTKARDEGYTYVTFIGGEITLVGWIFDAIKFIKKNKLGVGIVTNGANLSSYNYAEKLISSGLDHIGLSFHSHIAEDDYMITGLKNGLDLRIKAMHNLKRLRKQEKKYKLCINIVLNSVNYKYLKAMVKYLCKFNVDAFSIKNIIISGNIKNKNLIPNLKTIQPYIVSTIEYLSMRGVSFRLEDVPLCIIKSKFYVNDVHVIQKIKKKIIGGYGFVYNTKKNEAINTAIFNPTRNKYHKCQQCVLNNLCTAPQEEYMNIFGNDALNPINNIDEVKRQLKSNIIYDSN